MSSDFSGAEYPDDLGQRDALRRSMRRHLEQMTRIQPARGDLLEVGCAYGLFLDEARHSFESVTGIDICAAPIAHARDVLKLDARQGDFLTADFGRTFDVICMWDTIEHLPTPDEYVTRAAALLRAGGMLFLTTGDIGSLNARWRGAAWRQIHPPSHVNYFSRQTIGALLQRTGYEVVGFESAKYFHTVYNILASMRIRGGLTATLANKVLSAIGESRARECGLWINLGDIKFVAARRRVSGTAFS